jgi:hypothetical protein
MLVGEGLSGSKDTETSQCGPKQPVRMRPASFPGPIRPRRPLPPSLRQPPRTGSFPFTRQALRPFSPATTLPEQQQLRPRSGLSATMYLCPAVREVFSRKDGKIFSCFFSAGSRCCWRRRCWRGLQGTVKDGAMGSPFRCGVGGGAAPINGSKPRSPQKRGDR